MDLLPQGTILTLIIQPQDRIEENFSRLSIDSMWENVDSLRAREDASRTRTFLGNKHKIYIYRAAISLLIRAQDPETLNKCYLDIGSKLLNCSLEPVNQEHNIGPLSSYLRAKPMCFNPQQDRNHWYTRLMFVENFACLAPVYGRDTGTGNTGFTFFNRGGRPLCVDPLNKNDCTQNVHKLLFSPTGAGKSDTMPYELAQMMAIYRPRIFLLDAGNSFGLFGDYCASLGLKVHRVSIKPGKVISLAPFGDSHLLMQVKPDAWLVSEEAFRVLMRMWKTIRARMKSVTCWVRWRLRHTR